MKSNTFELSAKVVVTPSRFLATIQGIDGCLFNKAPDLSDQAGNKDKRVKDKHAEELRTWRNKLHTNADGEVIWPGENLHEMLKGAAKYWGATVPGEGKKTYTNIVLNAVVVEDMPLGIKADDDKAIIPYGKNCNATPTKPKGGLVYRIRPFVRPWGGSFVIHVFDERINLNVLSTLLTYGGQFGGMGDWRPKFGRFNLTNLEKLD